MNNREFRNLFNGLCCSQCRNDFDIDDIFINEQYGDLKLCHLKCHKCGKDFGDVMLNFNRHANYHSQLEVIEGPLPINSDDVLDAHEFIKKNL